MKSPVYLDYAATTPMDSRVVARMQSCLTIDGVFANPASRSHLYGWQAEEMIENARLQLADLIAADPREIVWASGATEADNLALKGVAEARQQQGRHIITSAIEHKAVLDSCAWLQRQGFEVDYLQPETNAQISPDKLAAALREDTILVSLMHVNNETGTINDLSALAEVVGTSNALFHTDAAQSLGKLPFKPAEWGVDLASFSGHKLYGPKGIGALYVRRDPQVRVAPQIHGGGHERGMRSGTLATHQIVAMGEAAAIAAAEMGAEQQRLAGLRQQLVAGLEALDGICFNGDQQHCLVSIINFSVADVDGETLMNAMPDLALSNGSACNSATVEPSYVISALGVSRALSLAALRISMGRFTSEQDIEFAVNQLTQAITGLRRSRL